MKGPARRPRRLRFGLRFVAIVVLICSAGFAWMGRKLSQNRQRIAAAGELSASGVAIDYVQSFVDQGDRFAVSAAKPPWFARLCRLLGEQPPIFVNSLTFYSSGKLDLVSHFPEVSSIYYYAPQLPADDLAALARSPNLQFLSLSCEDFPDSDSAFGDRCGVETLQLSDQVLDDQAVGSLCKLPRLRLLALANCQLTASPKSLRQMQRLDLLSHLVIRTSQSAPLAGFATLPQIRSLRMAHLAGGDPHAITLDCLKCFPELEHLDLSTGGPMNRFDVDYAPLEAGALGNLVHTPRLQSLRLSSRQIDDRDLELIARHSQIRELRLADTDVSDGGVSFLASMDSLEYLDLERTLVGDAGIGALWNLPNLKTLLIDGTEVTPAVRDEFFITHPDCADGLYMYSTVLR